MDDSTITFMNELRKAFFSALNDVRKELGEKIDSSATERRKQIDDLLHNGCFQGRLDRQLLEQHATSIEQLKGMLASAAIANQPKPVQEEQVHKKFIFDLRKMKFSFSDFDSSAIVQILMILILGGLILRQEFRLNKVEHPHVEHDQKVVSK